MGFDWKHAEEVWDKVREELRELQEEVARGNRSRMEEEFGDFIFSIINAARVYDINPEDALEKTNREFIRSFNYMEDCTNANGHTLPEISLEEMEALWQEAKMMKNR